MFMNLHFPHLLDFYEKTLSKRKKIVFGLPWWPTFFQELGPQTITLLLCGKWCRSFFIFHSLFEMVAKRKYILYIMDYSRKKTKQGGWWGWGEGEVRTYFFEPPFLWKVFYFALGNSRQNKASSLENPQNWAIPEKKQTAGFSKKW